MEEGCRSAVDAAALVDCMVRNVPCVLPVDSQHWEISRQCLSSEGTLDVQRFKEAYGSCTIPVEVDSSSYSAERTTMTVAALLDRMLQGHCVYGKDWHFCLPQNRSHDARHIEPAFSSAFVPPAAVREDWLNWYSDLRGNDDFRFLYIGGPGTRTGLHYDVLCSYSWSVNIVGRKLWRFWDPSVVGSADGRSEGDLGSPTLELCQSPQQLVFVPSGWHHTVANLGADASPQGGITVSVNHNWMNGFNIYRVWRFIAGELRSVRAEMACFRRPGGCPDPSLMDEGEWLRHCELTMRANCSFSVLNFFELLSGRLLYVLVSESTGRSGDAGAAIPEWARVFCGDICDSIVGPGSCSSFYKQSCSVHVAYAEDNVEDNEQSTVELPCPRLSRTDTARHANLPLAMLSQLSIPAFGVLETYRILIESQQWPDLVSHVAASASAAHGKALRAAEVQFLLNDMASSAAGCLPALLLI